MDPKVAYQGSSRAGGGTVVAGGYARAQAADAIGRSISRSVATFLTSGRHLCAGVGRPDALSPAIATLIYCQGLTALPTEPNVDDPFTSSSYETSDSRVRTPSRFTRFRLF